MSQMTIWRVLIRRLCIYMVLLIGFEESNLSKCDYRSWRLCCFNFTDGSELRGFPKLRSDPDMI